MSHYKDVNGQRLLCWGRAGDTYKVYEDQYFKYQTTEWFDALRNAAEGSWKSEYPVKIKQVTYVRDYGVDRMRSSIDIAEVMCNDNYNITVDRKNDD